MGPVLRVDGPAAAAAALAARPAGDPVVVLPASGARVVGPLDELHERLASFEAPVVTAPDGVLPVAGPAGSVAALLGGEVVDAEPDLDGVLFAEPYEAPSAGRALVPTVDGPVLRRTGLVPLVLLGGDDELDAALAAAAADPATAALARLLAPAAPPAPGWSEVAPELVRMPFWSPERCADLVTAAEAFGRWGSDETDPVPGDEVPLATISPALVLRLEEDLDAHVVPRLREHWPLFGWVGVLDAFVIRYGVDPGAPPVLGLHHDVAQISASVRLNEGYEGGSLEFPRQGFTNDGAAVGELLAFPSLVTHPHRSTPVRAGVRYGLTIWFRIPEP